MDFAYFSIAIQTAMAVCYSFIITMKSSQAITIKASSFITATIAVIMAYLFVVIAVVEAVPCSSAAVATVVQTVVRPSYALVTMTCFASRENFTEMASTATMQN